METDRRGEDLHDHDDGYTGHVEPSGPWIDRRDGPVEIRKLSVGPMNNNAYVVSCAATRRGVLIDAPADADRLREAIAGREIEAILLTHGHADHLGAWEELRDGDGLPVWGHAADSPLHPGPVDRQLSEGNRLVVGEITIDVIHIAAHTEGSLLYLTSGTLRPHLFSGDTLFPGGHGTTTTPHDHERIMDGLESQIFRRLPDETWVYPGHGDDTTLGAERPHLSEWRARGW